MKPRVLLNWMGTESSAVQKWTAMVHEGSLHIRTNWRQNSDTTRLTVPRKTSNSEGTISDQNSIMRFSVVCHTVRVT